MTLNIDTLLVINAANVLAMALTLPAIMGRSLSDSAQRARLALILQGLAWTAMIASGRWKDDWPDWALSTLSIGLNGAAQWWLYLALKGWLGRRPMERLMLALVVLTPLGYGLTFENYAIRVGWSNGLLALQLLILARAVLWPATSLGGRWRWVLLVCLVTMAGFTLARGVMGAFFTELYPYFRAPHPVNMAAMLAANVSLVLCNVAVLVAWREEAETQLHERAITDGLTGVLNRHGWLEKADPACAAAQQHNQPLALLVMDLDHFKAINDQHGHETGDEALRVFSDCLRAASRPGDVIARLGGEEFAVLLVHATEAAARSFDQRLRQLLAQAAAKKLHFGLNFSAGLALREGKRHRLDHMLPAADQALYQAKRSGRNQLVVAAPEETSG